MMCRIGLLLLLLFPGCSSYEVQPLDELGLLEELRAACPTLPSEGIDQDQAVALALVHNPGLEAARRARDVARAMVVSAGVWENPELRLSLQNLYSSVANPISLAMGLRVFMTPPGEIDGRVERARARDRRRLAELEDREKGLAVLTMLAHARVLMLDSKLRILQSMDALQERVERIVVARVESGAATAFDSFLVRLKRESSSNELGILGAARAEAEAELASLLGASPGVNIPVRGRPGSLMEPELEQATLENLAVLERSDLLALKAGFDEQEQSVKLAHVSSGFWPRFLQAAFGGVNRKPDFGWDAAIEVPIFDTGSADITVAEAQRNEAKELYRSRLHDVRKEIRTSVLEFTEQRRRRRFHEERLQPLLREAESLLDSEVSASVLDPLDLVTMATALLEARKEVVEATFDHERARIRLAAVTGVVFAAR